MNLGVKCHICGKYTDSFHDIFTLGFIDDVGNINTQRVFCMVCVSQINPSLLVKDEIDKLRKMIGIIK